MKTETRKFTIYEFLIRALPSDWLIKETEGTLYLKFDQGIDPKWVATIRVRTPFEWNVAKDTKKKDYRIIEKVARRWENYIGSNNEVTLTLPPVELNGTGDNNDDDDDDDDDD
jgi:hypothetical protein